MYVLVRISNVCISILQKCKQPTRIQKSCCVRGWVSEDCPSKAAEKAKPVPYTGISFKEYSTPNTRRALLMSAKKHCACSMRASSGQIHLDSCLQGLQRPGHKSFTRCFPRSEVFSNLEPQWLRIYPHRGHLLYILHEADISLYFQTGNIKRERLFRKRELSKQQHVRSRS